MRVLIWLGDARVFGGQQVQLRELVPRLRDRGIGVEATDEEPSSLDGIDVVLGLGLSPAQIRRVRSSGVPVVYSTVYWPGPSHARKRFTKHPELARRLRIAASLGLAGLRLDHAAKVRALGAGALAAGLTFESADVLLPNAIGEAESIRRDLGVTTPSVVVPNAADPVCFTLGDASEQRAGVLSVGRFEPHKNQLGLIKALHGQGISLTLVGPVHPDHPRYIDECRRVADAQTVFHLGRFDAPELAEHYRRAEVHALPTWFETTGLVSLEAALCGAKVVSTDRGHAREYLEDDAWYCDPADEASIRAAVVAALAAPHRDALRLRILDRFTWSHTAEATIDGYRRAIDMHRRATPTSDPEGS
jgi:glycosyltransferase involved in cell wall biosynthesis